MGAEWRGRPVLNQNGQRPRRPGSAARKTAKAAPKAGSRRTPKRAARRPEPDEPPEAPKERSLSRGRREARADAAAKAPAKSTGQGMVQADATGEAPAAEAEDAGAVEAQAEGTGGVPAEAAGAEDAAAVPEASEVGQAGRLYGGLRRLSCASASPRVLSCVVPALVTQACQHGSPRQTSRLTYGVLSESVQQTRCPQELDVNAAAAKAQPDVPSATPLMTPLMPGQGSVVAG